MSDFISASYILDIYLQVLLVMVKVIGKLKSLVIKGEDCLEKGQHLERQRERKIGLRLSKVNDKLKGNRHSIFKHRLDLVMII